jgi:hypothetical protein
MNLDKMESIIQQCKVFLFYSIIQFMNDFNIWSDPAGEKRKALLNSFHFGLGFCFNQWGKFHNVIKTHNEEKIKCNII